MSTWLLLRTIGHDAALALQRRFQGRKVYVRVNPDEADPIAQVIGIEAAHALARELGGEVIRAGSHLVLRDRNARIVRLHHAGANPSTIAALLGISPRWVRKVLEAEGERRA